MSDEAKPARLYDEAEVTRILKRATELQQEEPVRSASAGGMSLVELEDIAREAGIPSGLVRRAAREIDTHTPGAGIAAEFFGAPLSLVFDRTLPGEIGDNAFEELVVVIQRHADRHGQPSLLGRTLTWQGETQSKNRTLQVVVSSRDGETDIRVEERFHQLAGGLFGGIVGGGGSALGFGLGLPVAIEVLGSAALAVTFPVASLSVAWMVARAIYRTSVNRRRAALGRLLEALTDEVEAAIRRRVESARAAAELPPGRASP